MRTSPLIEFKDVSKSFGSVKANQSVSFSVFSNSFHGVVGENGAGKSTIMKILFGLIHPDSGHIYLRGKSIDFESPHDAIEQGIGMVHQHFMLVPTLTVWENIILGSEPSLLYLNSQKIIKELTQLQTEFGFSLDLSAVVEDLSLGQQQQVEILKLLYRKAQILIFDEPTAVLTPQEVTRLFEKLKGLQLLGKTILVVTHKLKEILTYSEVVTVMRGGRSIETVDTDQLTEDSLSQLIMGRPRLPLPARKSQQDPAPALLEIKSLYTHATSGRNLRDLNLSVHAGQIVGLAGIEGQGQQELVDVLCQIEPFSGTISLLGSPLQATSAYSKRQNGFSLIPPDRQTEGLVLDFSCAENFLLGHQREPVFKQMDSVSEELMKTFDVRPNHPQLPSRFLSGGNQQKLVVARETSSPVRFLLACNPTRGIDIGSIEFIHSHFLKLAEKGAAILLISTELDELLALSDSIVVIRDGTIVFESATPNVSLKDLGLWMTGART